MRPGLILLVVALALVATCTTAAKRDHARMLKMSSPDFAQANDAVSNKVRLLRSSEIDGNEERGTAVLTPYSNSILETAAGKGGAVGQKAKTKLHLASDELTMARIQSQVNERARTKELMQKEAQLTSHADIEGDLKALSYWYKKGKTPDTLFKEKNLVDLDNLPVAKRFENKDYRQFVTFEKLYNIMKNEEPSRRQIQMERYDAVMLNKAQLISHDDINAKFNKVLRWYVIGKTPAKVWKDQNLEPLMEKVITTGKGELSTNKKYQEAQTYNKFYDIMKNQMP